MAMMERVATMMHTKASDKNDGDDGNNGTTIDNGANEKGGNAVPRQDQNEWVDATETTQGERLMTKIAVYKGLFFIATYFRSTLSLTNMKVNRRQLLPP